MLHSLVPAKPNTTSMPLYATSVMKVLYSTTCPSSSARAMASGTGPKSSVPNPEGPIECDDTITTTNTTTSITTINHARSVENTRNTQWRTGRRRKGISAEELGKRKHNPLPHLLWSLRLGRQSPERNKRVQKPLSPKPHPP
ncbi:neurocan [Phyllostomus discolor]|uniref:Neurocan n=1 Tax=Phyllostomus discolor TaxID=89673 RepID=A0A833ZQN4_9CHIR|nr:neurocan [Phyllostomus discolor]